MSAFLDGLFSASRGAQVPSWQAGPDGALRPSAGGPTTSSFFAAGEASSPSVDSMDNPAALDGIACVVHETDLIVVGGWANDRIWKLSLPTLQWSEHVCRGQLPAPRVAHTANVFAGFLIITGGEHLRGHPAEKASGSEIVVNCGGNQSSTTASVIVPKARVGWKEAALQYYELDLETLEWSAVKTTGDVPVDRSHHTANVVRDVLVILGGKPSLNAPRTAAQMADVLRSSSFYDVFVLSIVQRSWRRVDLRDPPTPTLWGHSAVSYRQNYIVVFGGFDVSASDSAKGSPDMPPVAVLSDSVYILNTDSLRWARVAAPSVSPSSSSSARGSTAASPRRAADAARASPRPRAVHCAATLQSLMVVAGGIATHPGTGELYCPADIWAFDIEAAGSWCRVDLLPTVITRRKPLMAAYGQQVVFADTLSALHVLTLRPSPSAMSPASAAAASPLLLSVQWKSVLCVNDPDRWVRRSPTDDANAAKAPPSLPSSSQAFTAGTARGGPRGDVGAGVDSVEHSGDDRPPPPPVSSSALKRSMTTVAALRALQQHGGSSSGSGLPSVVQGPPGPVGAVPPPEPSDASLEKDAVHLQAAESDSTPNTATSRPLTAERGLVAGGKMYIPHALDETSAAMATLANLVAPPSEADMLRLEIARLRYELTVAEAKRTATAATSNNAMAEVQSAAPVTGIRKSTSEAENAPTATSDATRGTTGSGSSRDQKMTAGAPVATSHRAVTSHRHRTEMSTHANLASAQAPVWPGGADGTTAAPAAAIPVPSPAIVELFRSHPEVPRVSPHFDPNAAGIGFLTRNASAYRPHLGVHTNTTIRSSKSDDSEDDAADQEAATRLNRREGDAASRSAARRTEHNHRVATSSPSRATAYAAMIEEARTIADRATVERGQPSRATRQPDHSQRDNRDWTAVPEESSKPLPTMLDKYKEFRRSQQQQLLATVPPASKSQAVLHSADRRDLQATLALMNRSHSGTKRSGYAQQQVPRTSGAVPPGSASVVHRTGGGSPDMWSRQRTTTSSAVSSSIRGLEDDLPLSAADLPSSHRFRTIAASHDTLT